MYIKDSDRAIGIIDRLWAVGELTSEQRVAMVSKIDEKRIAIENEKKQKLEKITAYFRQFYKNTGTNTKKRKGCHVEQR